MDPRAGRSSSRRASLRPLLLFPVLLMVGGCSSSFFDELRDVGGALVDEAIQQDRPPGEGPDWGAALDSVLQEEEEGAGPRRGARTQRDEEALSTLTTSSPTCSALRADLNRDQAALISYFNGDDLRDDYMSSGEIDRIRRDRRSSSDPRMSELHDRWIGDHRVIVPVSQVNYQNDSEVAYLRLSDRCYGVGRNSTRVPGETVRRAYLNVALSRRQARALDVRSMRGSYVETTVRVRPGRNWRDWRLQASAAPIRWVSSSGAVLSTW